MTPDPDNSGWYLSTPDSQGEYLVIDASFWHLFIGTWIPGEGKRPGRWYLQSRPYCEADGVAKWRPLPRVPLRPDPAMKTVNHS